LFKPWAAFSKNPCIQINRKQSRTIWAERRQLFIKDKVRRELFLISENL
jgi:hypothetical protein